MPPPWLGVHVFPSSSVNAEILSCPVSCETKVRLVKRSVNKMASRLCSDSVGKVTFSHVALAGEVQSLNVMRNVCKSVVMGSVAVPLASKKTFLVFQSTPQEGSPACWPRGAGAG